MIKKERPICIYFVDNMTKPPFISIIVTVLNGEKTLHHFLQSVATQSYLHYELIIIEGGSTDKTLDLLAQNANVVTQLKQIKGVKIYAALNEGIKMATGDWLYFIGCDDSLYTPYVLEQIAPLLNHQKYDYISGAVINQPSGKKFWPRPHTQWLFHSLHHQATFYHRTVFDRFTYDEKYIIASDYELTLNLFLKRYRLKTVPTIIANFNETGFSGKNPDLAWAECEAIRIKLYGMFIGTLLNKLVRTALWIMYTFRQMGHTTGASFTTPLMHE
ncbi:glycosyltransferase [Telluribacter humicola]|uniref:glycosyltransferase n=1 Tax=Telluribacter humicola TaxID=1720261 RepID=UPI001A959E6B|nr:glycosyltransferase [Telluribacter humicola]